MVMVKCRNCGADVPSDEKARKCRACGTLFPFVCAVCDRKMRPPLADYPIERYFNDDGEPLCEDHYQRQCPECSRWFQADENPGFYLCHDCTERREGQLADGTIGQDTVARPERSDEHTITPEMEEEADKAAHKAGCGSAAVLFFAVAVTVARALWA
jgi:hypothetical protein